MRDQIRKTLQASLRRESIDVYIGCTPANFHYVSGFQSPFIELSWQMTGTDLVILPADEKLPPTLIVSEYAEPFAAQASDITDIRTFSMWTEGRTYAEVSGRNDAGKANTLDRPIQYNNDEIFSLLSNVLEDRGLSGCRVGTDLSLMKHETYRWFEKTFGESRLSDCRRILYESRSIKQPFEIERIRHAAHLFDAGVAHCANQIQLGQTAADLRSIFLNGVTDAAESNAELGPVEDSFFFEHIGTQGGPVSEGDIVKLDCGVKIGGYWSDGCRHFSMGNPSTEQQAVHDALMSGFESAEQLMKPGVKVRDIYSTALNAVRSNGLPNYSRGHFGHSIGLDDQTEEPPFLGPTDAVLKPNMVMCLEIPYYPADVGGFNIEDMYLITETGYELLTHLPRDLKVLEP